MNFVSKSGIRTQVLLTALKSRLIFLDHPAMRLIFKAGNILTSTAVRPSDDVSAFFARTASICVDKNVAKHREPDLDSRIDCEKKNGTNGSLTSGWSLRPSERGKNQSMVVADQLAERWIPKPECMLLLNSILHACIFLAGDTCSLCVCYYLCGTQKERLKWEITQNCLVSTG